MGLVILAFPCNQFGGQEPGTSADIRAFAESKGVPVSDQSRGFLLMEKVDVNGPASHTVYKFLKGATEDSRDIKWNFGSYWLVDAKGSAQRLEGLRTSPASFADKVAKAVNA